MAFELDGKLKEDSLILGSFKLCMLLRIKDQNYPWYVLVPQRASLREVYELNEADRQQYYKESHQVCEALVAFYKPDKINLASIGNVVAQLHIHHIARFRDDISWPAPVWGSVPMRLDEPELLRQDSLEFVRLLSDFVKAD